MKGAWEIEEALGVSVLFAKTQQILSKEKQESNLILYNMSWCSSHACRNPVQTQINYAISRITLLQSIDLAIDNLYTLMQDEIMIDCNEMAR